MLFRVIEHYEDFSEYKSSEPNECLICLEINTHDNLTPIDLKMQQMYLKMCNCGGWVHVSCLSEWQKISSSCPICRLYMDKPVSMISTASFHVIKICGTFLLVFIRLCYVFWFVLVLACGNHIYQYYFTLNPHKDADSCEYITE
jgi:hypothetical protein